MTGIVKHAENAAKARRELESVKAQASEVINGLVSLVKSMYVFADNLEGMNFDGKPVRDVVADLIGAETAEELRAALAPSAGGDGERVECSTHPDAPHGFDRNGSHSADRYVCDCESWQPPAAPASGGDGVAEIVVGPHGVDLVWRSGESKRSFRDKPYGRYQLATLATRDGVCEFNVNHDVWVRLTDVGRKVLAENHDNLYAIYNRAPEYVPPKEVDGWAKFQLWSLMAEFGRVMGNGFSVPFETTIRIAAAPKGES